MKYLMTVLARWCLCLGLYGMAAGATACGAEDGAAMKHDGGLDLVLAGGRVIDPARGVDAVRNVGVSGRRIVMVSEKQLNDELRAGGRILDVTGLVVAPGFIDLHAHGQSNQAHNYQIRDGVTTALELEWGYPSIRKFLQAKRGKSRVNYGASVSHGFARSLVIADAQGDGDKLRGRYDIAIRLAEPLQPLREAARGLFRSALAVAQMESLNLELEHGLAEGGIGVGVALQYYPGASHEEVHSVYQFAARHRVPVFTHVRSMTFAAMQEAIANAATTGASLHIVHVNSMSLGNIGKVLQLIGEARARGLDVSTEAYPYTAASARIRSAIFDEGWQDRLGITYSDIQLQDSGERLTRATFGQYRVDGGRVIMHMMKDGWIDMAIATPWVMIASDGMPYAPGAHPRSAGTFSRVLGRYVRQKKLIDLPGAIRKMTLLPATRLQKIAPQMRKKGRIQPGCDADITVFDADKVIDTSDFDTDLNFSTGVVHVFIAGTQVVRGGQILEEVFPGEAILGGGVTTEQLSAEKR